MINFNPINNIMKIQTSYPASKPLSFGLKQDVFVRSTNNVSFAGNSQEKFSTWAEENNFVENLQEIIQNEENKLGKGFSHSAYTIPNCDDYILRAPSSIAHLDLNFSDAQIEDTADEKLNINIGQEVASIEVPTKEGFPFRIEVLKKQTGKSIGVPPSQAIYVEDTGKLREGELPYEARERKEHYAETIHKVSQLPVESYEKLIDDVIAAADAGYKFDHLNSNNLLIDEENSSINLIDMDKAKTSANLGNVLYALTNICYLGTFMSQYDDCPMSSESQNQAIGDTIEIIEKFIQAMKNKGLKFNEGECSYEFFNLMSSLPMSFCCRTGDYNAKWQALRNQGVA